MPGPAGRLRRCWPGPRVGPRTAGDVGYSLGPSFAGGRYPTVTAMRWSVLARFCGAGGHGA
eukprot:10908060-Alexandrium_andersonii.AAC.1